MTNTDAGGGDRLALAVLTQYRMGTTGQLHRVLAPGVRIEQTRRRLGKLRTEGLVDRVTLPQAGLAACLVPHRVRGTGRDGVAGVAGAATAAVGVRSCGRAAAGLAHPGGDRDRARLPRGRPAPRRDVPAAGLGTRSAPPDRQRRGRHTRRAAVLPVQRRAAARVRRSRPRHHGPRTPGRQTHRLRPPPPPHTHPRPRTPAAPQHPKHGGIVAAAVSALPPAAVRPGRHRPRRYREPRPCPPRSHRRPGGEHLPAPRPHPRRPTHRPTRTRAHRTHMATHPGSRPAMS